MIENGPKLFMRDVMAQRRLNDLLICQVAGH
jgi:hypothetical protein